MYKYELKKVSSIIIIIILLPLSLLFLNSSDEEAVASSPAFELQEITNENPHWVQTYGTTDAHLKTNYTDIKAVNYRSDGKTLNTTIWLASGFTSSSPVYNNDPFRKITYGILIDADSNPKTGYNGADYDFYVELVAGKLSGYLYHLSSTGGYRLIGSKINFTQPVSDSTVGPAYVNLHLDLSSINSPSKYNLLFYTAESFKSNEVRQFTNWISIPPPSLEISTSPSNVTIRQGEEQLIPARIMSTSGFSNDVINVTVAGNSNNNNYYDIGSGFNSSELHVVAQRNQPPLFKIAVPRQTPLGIYTIPLIATIREPSAATITKPISINTRGGTVNPKFELSKKFPTVGYLTRPLSLTVHVIAPKNISDQFKDFWGTYGQFIGLFAGGFVGAYAKVLFDRRKRRENE
ncbi:MAG TPA: hypothetical protein VFD60_09540 [Nitrososphaeraceae archaeon]|nr:hypothetical protein [Nitrososphaeraceae archaeon]